MLEEASVTGRIEQKFFIPPGRMTLALALLRRTCRADGEHPRGDVTSLYFDTIALLQHEKSLSGEYDKDKVRVRWYDAPDGGGPEHGLPQERIRVWIELKSRRGFVSTKQRRAVEVGLESLSNRRMSMGIVASSTLVETLAGFGHLPGDRLLPVILVSYRRLRFIEPRTGTRASFDWGIRSSAVLPGLGRGERDLELPGAVVEVKGRSLGLPAGLRGLLDFGSAWSRYSKYSSSLEAHSSALGSVSRLWPSGTMDRGRF